MSTEVWQKQRELHKGTVDTLIHNLGNELAQDPLDQLMIETYSKRLNSEVAKVEVLDGDILEKMLGQEDVKPEALRKEKSDSDAFAIKVTQMQIRVSRCFAPKPVKSEPSEAGGSDSGKRKAYKLPKIQLKKFDGEYKNWLGFWAQFEKIHTDPDIHDSDKFQYLAQAMTPGSKAKELVERYPQSDSNYHLVIEDLRKRFGKEKLLKQVYVRELLNMVIQNYTCNAKVTIGQMYDKLKSHLNTLSSLGVNSDQMAIFLYPLVESSLPENVLIAWQHSTLKSIDGSILVPPKNELELLMDFLEQEVDNEDQRLLAKIGYADNKSDKPQYRNHDKKFGKSQEGRQRFRRFQKEDDVATAAGLHVGHNNPKKACLFCGKPHQSESCFKAQGMTFGEKKQVILDKKACDICLRVGHKSSDCKCHYVKCTGCDGKHHHLMCPESRRNRPEAQAAVATEVAASNIVGGKVVLLETQLVKIKSTPNNTRVRVLYDRGSQGSYLTSNKAKEAKCEAIGSIYERNLLFGGSLTIPEMRTTYKVILISLDGKTSKELHLKGKDRIAGGIPIVPNGPWLDELKRRNVVISDNMSESEEIDVLIGSDVMPSLLTGKTISLKSGLIATETVFGWTLMGPVATAKKSAAMAVTSMMISDISIPNLWNLDVLGIEDSAEHKSRAQKDAEVKDHFLKTVKRKEDGRYIVDLPWVGGVQAIPTNRFVAEKRLMTTTQRLKKDGMFKTYDGLFKQWEAEGFIEAISDTVHSEKDVCHYLPHRAVYKPESLTTPVRPVFDASCKVGRNPSLNECLEKGPNYVELIPTIMLRFREGKYGVLSDIRKAFQMIDVRERDCDFLRFLWWKNEDSTSVKVYRHRRVVFGVSSSVFLLGAVIEHHLSKVAETDKETAEKFLKCLYVDNCVTSVASYDEYERFKRDTTRMLASAKMELRQWEFGPVETSGVGPLNSRRCGLAVGSVNSPGVPESSTTSVLGMKWNKEEDFLRCDTVPEIPEKLTKRNLLSAVQKIFDPMGFLSPVMVVPKLLLQEVWAQKLGWDEDIPENTRGQVKRWAEELKCLEAIHIPRRMNGGSDDRRFYELHMFCDASRYAYATAVFLRVVIDDKTSLQLLQSKARVAPMKETSIPRLELLSCVIGARLVNSIKASMNLEVPTFYWSDSTTALAWIKRNDEWGTFVGNRVREICTLTNPDDWRHVPGIHNPADLPSRGCTSRELLASKWWEGPEWLKSPPQKWPTEEVVSCEDTILLERKKGAVRVILQVGEKSAPEGWYVNIHSSHIKCLRIWALINRYKSGCMKRPHENGIIKVSELETAETQLFRQIQMEVFPETGDVIKGIHIVRGKAGSIRVKTKLLNREDHAEFKFPMLLPHSHPSVDRMIREEHLKNGHAGVQFLMSKIREKFWILQTRKAIRRVVQSCLRCRRYQEKSPAVPMAPLPENRIKNAKVFEVTGVDLAGPLFLKDHTKVWIVLFTCAVYRAVHLELVSSLNTDTFLLAMFRFISRRGRPSIVYSDNGTNFVGANNLFSKLDWKKIEKESSHHQIQWIFNPPSAAWWGGFWERLIQTVKGLLKRMLGQNKLNFDQLSTILCEVEAVVNDRPLTYVTEDQNDLIPLTPSMFLKDVQKEGIPEAKALNSDALRKKYKDFVQLKEELRHRFRSEYLGQLVQKGKAKSMKIFHVGEIVLVASDNKKRIEWPMAKIVELMPGKDGNVRVARIRTSSGEFVRPLQRLIPMEVGCDFQITPEIKENAMKRKMKAPATSQEGLKVKFNPVLKEKEQVIVTTRKGRKVKVPERFVPKF